MLRLDAAQRKGHLDAVVRDAVAQTLHALLDAAADALGHAPRYPHRPDRLDTRAGHYPRTLPTKAGEGALKVPRLRTLPFETQLSERYRRRASSVAAALLERYRAGVSVRRVEDSTAALGGTQVSPSTVSALHQKVYARNEAWRKRNWGGEVKNGAVLVAVGVGADGHRARRGVREGGKEDAASGRAFLRHGKARGLRGVIARFPTAQSRPTA